VGKPRVIRLAWRTLHPLEIPAVATGLIAEDAFTGTATVIQRFDSALRLNVHLRTFRLMGFT
jgi:hypothetical protein